MLLVNLPLVNAIHPLSTGNKFIIDVKFTASEKSKLNDSPDFYCLVNLEETQIVK